MPNFPTAPMFTTAQAYAVGCSPSALKHAARHGALTRVRRSVYLSQGCVVPHRAERAAALVYPATPLCHTAAARISGVPLVGVGVPVVEMTVVPRSNAKMPGVHPYRAQLRDHDVTVVDGMLVTSYARTVIDLARDYPIVTSVPALDFVLHRGLVTADELRDVLEFCRSWPNARRARRAVLLSDSRSESPLESISRLMVPRLGLPVPEPQVIILDQFGREIARTDFYWDEFGVVGEADGRGKYGDPDAESAEKTRHERLDNLRLETTRWGWAPPWSDHVLWRQQLRLAFERGQDRDQAGLARLWTPVSTPRIAVL